MARFLVGTIPVIGHVNPALPIARTLVERGHDVWWYTGKAFQTKVEAIGAHFVPIKTGFDLTDPTSLLTELLAKQNSLTGLAQFKFGFKYLFGDSAVAQVKDYLEILKQFPADVMLADVCFLGAAWTHEQGGPAWATLGVTPLAITSNDTAPFGLAMPPATSVLGRLRNNCLNWLFQQILAKDLTVYLNTLRASLGLPPDSQFFFDSVVSPYLYLQTTVSGFEYPRRNLPPQLHFIGPVLTEPPTEFVPPRWWNDLKSSKPVVHVTQGTVATEASDLLIPTLQALAEEEVLVVATTGGQPIDAIALDSLPANVRLEPFIPHSCLLPHVDVMVTNGGYNGTHMALAFGVPMVAAGQTEEKPEVCARIAWSQVGIDLRTKTPTPTQIRTAVKQMLSEPHYRENAQGLQAEIARCNTVSLAIDLLEQLAMTKEPVIAQQPDLLFINSIGSGLAFK
ncbi:glycosyltransferase [Leptolyngbya sp. FACHB-321]|uniref:nucleotide disphospho-sugar-binding domain-containing protein n=1 Tax=Leptolyngbya sp. FACHB-321 TaxID=2692807 RepID=UPI001683B15B|nr:nucleotide disphospho-sugar-binding domain-containing protein [Leptolyngbya sp. FACHB-321]MBD2037686.1 glycosyltransferase [Leptolyngbya sp. FACHB-321]